VIRKARLFLVPTALGLLITSQWPDISRYLKIRQLSQGNGHPRTFPSRGRRPTHSARAMANKTAQGTSIRPAGEGRRKDRSKIAAITRSWT
jgi:hypothetical protein